MWSTRGVSGKEENNDYHLSSLIEWQLFNFIQFQTPLHVSAEYGHVRNVRLLLNYYGRIDSKDGLGFSALDLAVKGGHQECAAILHSAQSIHEASRLETYNMLLKACMECNIDQTTKLMKELKEDLSLVINMTTEGSNTLLFKYINKRIIINSNICLSKILNAVQGVRGWSQRHCSTITRQWC